MRIRLAQSEISASMIKKKSIASQARGHSFQIWWSFMLDLHTMCFASMACKPIITILGNHIIISDSDNGEPMATS